jgi:hypothetical protein
MLGPAVVDRRDELGEAAAVAPRPVKGNDGLPDRPVEVASLFVRFAVLAQGVTNYSKPRRTRGRQEVDIRRCRDVHAVSSR